MPSRRHRAAVVVLLALTAALQGCSFFGRGGDEETAAGANGEEAPRVVLRFEGLDEDRERNARAFLGLAEEPCDAPRWRIRRRMDRADEEIARSLNALGHYHATVEKDVERVEDCWEATFRVDPGPRVTVQAVDVVLQGEAAGDEAFQALLRDLPLREGAPLSHADYEAAKRRLTSLASERGYRDARLVRQRLLVDPQAGNARAELTLASGQRYRLGRLEVHTEALDEDLVRRIVEYQPGAPYSADRVHGIARALNDSGYFSSVDVRPRPEAAQDRHIPVDVHTRARKRHVYSASAGFATDTGPRIRLGYENRRINRRGHRLQARLQGGPDQSEASIRYAVPLQRPRSEWLRYTARLLYEDTDTYESTTGSVGVSATHLRGSWLEDKSIEFRRESFDVGQTSDTSDFLLPGLSYARTESDDPVRPSHGWKLFARLRGASEALLSDADLLHAHVDADWVTSLPGRGRIIFNGQAGALVTSDFDVLPPSLRFFAGGDNSIRGYKYQSQGPRDASGEVVGGRYLAVASVEYEHPLEGRWSGAVFVDAGNAFDDGFDEDVKVGVGIGVRWASPVGPVRVDLAHPVNDDGDTTVRLHLRLGPDL
jgi:translocation and assembly module TamA